MRQCGLSLDAHHRHALGKSSTLPSSVQFIYLSKRIWPENCRGGDVTLHQMSIRMQFTNPCPSVGCSGSSPFHHPHRVVHGRTRVSLPNDTVTNVIEGPQSVVGERQSLFIERVYILKKGVYILKNGLFILKNGLYILKTPVFFGITYKPRSLKNRKNRTLCL